ncbi:MAG: hypothetical protein JOY58_20930, partial [Solirubrobacterales bacterium]|nr:hypothetical protein [Solirubrobacterales bacterium]
MPRPVRRSRVSSRRIAFGLTVALAGFIAAAMVAVAIANTFTLSISKNAQVKSANGKTARENVVVNARGFAVYTLSGDSPSHAKCTAANGCFRFWPPVKVASAKSLSKASGVSGKLGVWRRNGLMQVTLGGHPLYTFADDTHRGLATGEGLQSFHGTWHVIKASSAKAPAAGSGTTPTTETPPTTGTP